MEIMESIAFSLTVSGYKVLEENEDFLLVYSPKDNKVYGVKAALES